MNQTTSANRSGARSPATASHANRPIFGILAVSAIVTTALAGLAVDRAGLVDDDVIVVAVAAVAAAICATWVALHTLGTRAQSPVADVRSTIVDPPARDPANLGPVQASPAAEPGRDVQQELGLAGSGSTRPRPHRPELRYAHARPAAPGSEIGPDAVRVPPAEHRATTSADSNADADAQPIQVARQPILDQSQHVVAYELRFRADPDNVLLDNQDELASRRLIGHGLTTFSLDDLTRGQRAHLTVSRSLLADQACLVIAPDKIVVEIVGSEPPDDAILEAGRALKRRGYQIVLRDVVAIARGNPYLAIADILRVDFHKTDPPQRQAISRANATRRYTLLADNVDTRADFSDAAGLGFDLFQGNFFQTPDLVTRRTIPSSKLASLQLIRTLNQSEVDWQRLEQVLKQDVGLPTKLLRYLNSAWFGLAQPVESLRHAMIMLGIVGLRQWVTLAIVTDLGKDRPPELTTISLIRAAMGERIAKAASLPRISSNAFLVGLFSSLDSLLGRPLDELIEELAVPADVRDALLGQSGYLSDIYQLVAAYERADWSAVSKQAGALGIDESILPPIYQRSVAWVDQILSGHSSARIPAA